MRAWHFVYLIYASKQAAFLELLDRWLAGLDAQLATARIGAETSPEALLQMAAMVGPVFQEASGQLPIFLEFWSKASHDPAIWQAANAPYRRYRAFFASLVENGIAEGTLRRVEPELAAQLFVSLAVGLVLQRLLDPQGADWGRVAQEGVRMILEGLQRR